MRIAGVQLSAWRNYDNQVAVFESSPTILIGSNGQGKTNFVEAIAYAARGKSHRVSADSALVGAGKPEAHLRMRVVDGNRTLDVDVAVKSSGSNQVRLNGQPSKKRELIRLLPVVMFAPEDMDIIRGEPQARRDFLDDVLALSTARFSGVLSDYDRVLRQRNALLKSLKSHKLDADLSTLDAWTENLIVLAGQIIRERRRIIDRISPDFARDYVAIAGGSAAAGLSIQETVGEDCPSAQIEERLRELFHNKQNEERERGTTLVGPHRDDLVITLNGLPGRTHSSQGEAWSLAIALRLAMVDITREASTVGDPVVILDDVFSELDNARRERLAAHLRDIEHIIITAADESSLPESLGGTRYRVSGGVIERE